MTTPLHKAAQMALDALLIATTPLAEDRQEVLRAITALRAALEAQPMPQGEPEPYAYAVYFPDQPCEELVHDLEDLCEDLTNREYAITPLFSAPPKREPLTVHVYRSATGQILLWNDCKSAVYQAEYIGEFVLRPKEQT